MAHRCGCRRVCFIEAELIEYPNRVNLAALDQLIIPLLNAAREFDGHGAGTAVEFVQWLAVDTKKMGEGAA